MVDRYMELVNEVVNQQTYVSGWDCMEVCSDGVCAKHPKSDHSSFGDPPFLDIPLHPYPRAYFGICSTQGGRLLQKKKAFARVPSITCTVLAIKTLYKDL